MKKPRIRCNTCNQDIFEFLPTKDELLTGLIMEASHFRGVGPWIIDSVPGTAAVCPFCGASLIREINKVYKDLMESTVLVGDWNE